MNAKIVWHRELSECVCGENTQLNDKVFARLKLWLLANDPKTKKLLVECDYKAIRGDRYGSIELYAFTSLHGCNCGITLCHTRNV
jgi:hypothetical protein